MLKFDYISMPDELPEKPEGWTQTLTCHMNMGRGNHAATYEIHDSRGNVMPISYQYTKSGRERGFTLPGVKPLMTWPELREIWKIWIKRARAKQRRMSA
jgi:hypothetical protein